MGITTLFSDLYDSLSFSRDVFAEAPADEPQKDNDEPDNDVPENVDGEEGAEPDHPAEAGDAAEAAEPEEEEEEEEEPVDLKPKFEEECARSKQCAPVKHHFDECVDRVTAAASAEGEKTGPHEDCVEEFFHLAHCANQCAAPKLWSVLK